MAEFAKLDSNNIVIQVVLISDEDITDPSTGLVSENLGKKLCEDIYGGVWIQTCSNGSFRKNFAGPDYFYDSQLDAFLKPKPYDSWILNLETCDWEPPIGYPVLDDNNIRYIWNEESQSWSFYNILDSN